MRSLQIDGHAASVRTSRSARIAALALALVTLAGCGGEAEQGPPEVHYGESVCVRCGMIVSDDRFATATIVKGDRGAEALVFDDFNCQASYESDIPPSRIIGRWAHDHESRTWLRSASAVYVRSPKLRTPMASGVAAFADRAAATRLAEELAGEVLTFDQLR